MNANDIIEKCARVCDRMVTEHETLGFHAAADIYKNSALQIRALKSTPCLKGGDANEPETLPGLDKSSPGVIAGASPADTVSEAMVEAAARVICCPRGCVADHEMVPCHAYQVSSVARASLEAAALAHADDGWRPIENAPKDGKAFLASSGGWLTLACWNKHRNGWCCVAPGYPNFPFDEQPTHFMSLQALPAPPKDGRE